MDDEGSWKKISTTMDIGVKLYSIRTESLYKDVFELFQKRITQDNDMISNDEDNNQDNIDEVKQNPEDYALSIFHLYNDTDRNTLDDPINLLSKKIDVHSYDSLFSKISGEVDEGGYRGLLINHIEVDDKINYIFYNEKLIEGKGFNTSTDDIYGSNLMLLKDEVDFIAANIYNKSICSELITFRSDYIDNRFGVDNDNRSVFTVDTDSYKENEPDEHYMDIEDEYENGLISEINSTQTPLINDEEYPLTICQENNSIYDEYFNVTQIPEQLNISMDNGIVTQPLFSAKFEFWNYLEPEMWRMS